MAAHLTLCDGVTRYDSLDEIPAVLAPHFGPMTHRNNAKGRGEYSTERKPILASLVEGDGGICLVLHIDGIQYALHGNGGTEKIYLSKHDPRE